MRGILITFLALGCASGNKPEPATPPSSVEAPATHLKGSLYRSSGVVELEKQQSALTFKALRCREEGERYVRVQVFLPDPQFPGVEAILLQLNGNLDTVKEKTQNTPQLKGGAPNLQDGARALAWVPYAELPVGGWVTFEAIKKEGPVDVSFSLDFGEKGKVEGRIVVDKTAEDVCVLPSPPMPPG